MPLIAGIDIGNATTEVALASDDPQARAFVASGIVATTGMKGTRDNIAGTLAALEQALAKTPWSMSDVSRIYLNEAAPVIGDVAMETITETIITESTMIGHNPQTPGGVGVGVGTTIALGRLATLPAAQYAEGWIVLIDDAVDFLDAVWWLNEALDRGINVVAAILKKDDGVLVNNRLRKTLPVVDEQVVRNAKNGENIIQLENQVGNLLPKALYSDNVLDSVSCFTTTQIAKELGITAQELNRSLCALHIQYYQSGQYLLYADYAHMGLAKSRTRYSAFLDPKSDGRQEKMGRAYTHTYLVWTERGRKFIHDLAQRYLELCEVYS